MKTDKEVAEEFARKNAPYSSLEPDSDYYQHQHVYDALLEGFFAGCKHKEESRWIPVSKDLPPSHNDVLIIEHDGKMMVDQMVWFGSTLDWKSTTPVAWTNLPTPPQTNK